MSGAPERFVGPAARWFDDFHVGDRLVTQGRTVTPADGLFWAMFSGDMNPMHVDAPYAARHGIFGGVFPPGLLAIAIGSGLVERLGFATGTGLAIVEQTIRYRKPVLPGDTIHVELVVGATTPHPSKPRGSVRFDYRIVDQSNEAKVEGEWVWLFATRTAGAASTKDAGPAGAG